MGYELNTKTLVKLTRRSVLCVIEHNPSSRCNSNKVSSLLNIFKLGVSMYSRVSVAQFYGLIFTLFFVPLVSEINLAQPIQKQRQNEVHLDQFNMLTTTSGWILLNQRLFWTSDAGQTWDEVSPSLPSGSSVQDVQFIDSNTGWMLWTMIAPDGSSLFQLAHTTDHGVTWVIDSLSLFESGEIASHTEKAEIGWFDTQTGWISVKQISSSNFSLGTLFITSDGGGTWRRSTLPVADHIYFNDPQIGWAIGGPTGDQIFKTPDGGTTWQTLRPDDVPEKTLAVAYMPFYSGGQGLLIMTHLGLDNSLEVYSLKNPSEKWLPVNRLTLDVQPGAIALSILDAQNFVATIPGTRSIVRMMDGELNVLDNEDGLSTSIVELDMVSLDVGWAKSVDSSCATAPSSDNEAVSVFCSSTTRLLRTIDGGITWQSIVLPLVQSDAAPLGIFSNNDATTMNSLSSLGNTQVFIGHGFDKCEIPTLSQLQAWWGHSPYKVVNLYVGGSARACENSTLTSSYLKQLYRQGWKFIPTWVGPQAPCTGYASRISNDVTTAYNQGVTQANSAVERLAELGLTYPDKTGSVIYYDIEYYGTNANCRNAVNSFMNGWVSQIHARGNLAGVYGSTLCNTGLSDFLNIANIPDVIWPARWYHNPGSGYYDPNANVWDLGSCIPNDVWADHQRVRQYEGSHNENWGNLPLEIDSNVLDGVVAIPYGFFVKSINRENANPTDATSVDFTVFFMEPVTGVNAGDFVLTTTSITGATITKLTGAGDTYTVTIDTGSGNGTIRLDIVDDDSIKDAFNNPLGGIGDGNGDYISGETYTILKDITFEDVSISYWAWQYIERLYVAGITGGCSISPLKYCPDDTVTRAQMAVFLERGLHTSTYNPPAATGMMFTDVTSDYWAAKWIEALATDGLTSGCGSGNYCPDDPVTRDQMAVFLLKAKYGSSYTPPAVESGTSFNDVLTDYWAAAWIKQLAAEGITGGCGTNVYCPGSPVTRAQMAVFLVRTFDLP